MVNNGNLFAFTAGICASGASLFGKLSGTFDIIGAAVCFAIMIILNAVMWTFYSKALNLSNTSIGPTVISSGTNYLISGALGILIFGEKTSLLWWSGLSCILLGVLLISKSNGSADKQD